MLGPPCGASDLSGPGTFRSRVPRDTDPPWRARLRWLDPARAGLAPPRGGGPRLVGARRAGQGAGVRVVGGGVRALSGAVVGVRAGGGGFQLASSTQWITGWGVRYALGVDGISLFMVLLTTFTTPLAILGSFNYITKKERGILRADAPPRDRGRGSVPLPGPLSLLHVLRAHPRAHVLHRGRLGEGSAVFTRH